MSVKTISRLLKFIIVLVGLTAFVLQGAVTLLFLVSEEPLIHSMQVPWIVFIWITAIPMVCALICSWKTADNIGKGSSFCIENAKNLHGIAMSALADSIIMLVGNVVLLLLNMNHPSVLLGALVIVVVGIAILVASECLSQLIKQATRLKEETDLTI